MQITYSDLPFRNSPPAGDLDCTCSRCGEIIQSFEMPIRIYTTNELGYVDSKSLEYRFCESCQKKSGIKILSSDDDGFTASIP